MEKWTNKGLLIRPSKKIWWMYSHVSACCAEVKINKLNQIIYFWKSER